MSNLGLSALKTIDLYYVDELFCAGSNHCTYRRSRHAVEDCQQCEGSCRLHFSTNDARQVVARVEGDGLE